MTSGSTYGQRKKSAEQRFWEKVKISDSDDRCFSWESAIDPNNRGFFWVGGHRRTIKAYQFIYELLNGPIQSGLVIRHTCDNPNCVNPNHLLSGTHLDNKTDSTSKMRHAYGTRNGGGVKLTENSVIRMRMLYPLFGFHRLAKMFGVSKPVAMRTIKGTLWKHVKNRSTI